MFLYSRSLKQHQLLENIKSGKLFGYVQCDVEVSDKLKPPHFSDFPPLFRNTLVDRKDIGKLMKQFAEEEGLMSPPQKMLTSSFKLGNGTLITPLLMFYPKLGLFVTKKHRFVEYTPKKCFNSFVQSAVDARIQSDENPKFSVVAETMKLLSKSSHGYQIMDPSRHPVTNITEMRKRIAL